MPPDPKECLLCDVFRRCAVQAHPSQIGEDPALMHHHDPAERQMVALGGLADVRVTVQGVAQESALYTGAERKWLQDDAGKPTSRACRGQRPTPMHSPDCIGGM